MKSFKPKGILKIVKLSAGNSIISFYLTENSCLQYFIEKIYFLENTKELNWDIKNNRYSNVNFYKNGEKLNV